jgi:hypothetical protein
MRDAGMAAGHLIVDANHRDNDAVEPLLAFYASWALAGAKPPRSAVDGLQRAMEEVPAAPATRVELGEALAQQGASDEARKVVLPGRGRPVRQPGAARGTGAGRRRGEALMAPDAPDSGGRRRRDRPGVGILTGRAAFQPSPFPSRQGFSHSRLLSSAGI